MIDGSGYVWTNEKTDEQTGNPTTNDPETTEIGHRGSGYAKIYRMYYSNNNLLTDLTFSKGSLDKDFDPYVQNYTLTVDYFARYVDVTAVLSDGTRLTGKVKVTSSPYIKVSGKKLVASKTYKIKCNKTLKVSLKGKAFSVKNKYKSTKKSVARVISGKDENILKIRGYKKGTAKVSITCNGVTFKIKVKVV
jgi:hypothetical protein